MAEKQAALLLQPSRIGFYLARLVVFVAFFDLFLQYPVAAPYATSLGASAGLVGIIVASYSIANLAGNVLAGIALDRFGRFWPLLFAVSLTALVVAAYAWVRSPMHLFALRLLHGATASVLAPAAFAVTGDLAAPEGRAQAMGKNGSVIALAAIIAPAIAGIVQDRSGFAAVFLLDAALIGLTGFFLVAFGQSLRNLLPARSARTRASFGLVLWRRQMGPYITIAAFTIGLGVLVTHVPERIQAWGAPATLRGAAFSLYGLLAALVMGIPWTARFVRADWRRGATLGLSLIAGGLFITSISGNGVLRTIEHSTLVGAAVFGVGFGLLFLAASTEVARRVSAEERGRSFGYFYAIYSLGVIVGALLTGGVVELTDARSGLPFLLGAASAGLGALVPYVERRRE